MRRQIHVDSQLKRLKIKFFTFVIQNEKLALTCIPDGTAADSRDGSVIN